MAAPSRHRPPPRRAGRRRSRRVLAGLVLLVAAACSGQAEEGPELRGAVAVAEGDLSPGDDLALPAEPILWVEGAVSTRNDGDALALDLAALERLPQHELTIFDPFDQEDATFRGVWLADLLAFAGVADGASMEAHALDDYRYAFTAEELADGQLFLALREDGQPLEVGNAGPTRIVFPASSTVGEVYEAWIWSLDVLTVG